MTLHTRAVAEAFSGHRFADAYDHLSPAVRWVIRGEETTEGKDDVISVCEQTLSELTNVTTEFTRFVVAADHEHGRRRRHRPLHRSRRNHIGRFVLRHLRVPRRPGRADHLLRRRRRRPLTAQRDPQIVDHRGDVYRQLLPGELCSGLTWGRAKLCGNLWCVVG